MRRLLAGGLVVGLLAGVALVIGAGAGKGSCPLHAGEAACGVPKDACPKVTGDCPRGEAACCEECPLKDDCPRVGQPGCCETCPVRENCPKAKVEEAKPAGCPMTAPKAAHGCGMHVVSGCMHAAAGAGQTE